MASLRKKWLVSAAVFLAFIMTFAPGVQAASSPTFSPIVNLSHDSGLSTEPIVASVGTNVYVAWEDNTNGFPQVYFVRSTDGGVTWDPISQFTGKGSATAVQIAATGQYVLLVWKQGNHAAFAASSNNGTSFEPTITFPNANGTVSEPSIATNGSKGIYLAWNFASTTNGSRSAIFTASHDGGITFSSPRRISGSISARELQISAQASYVYVVWTSNWVYFMRSADGGGTFSTPERISDPACTSNCLSREPMITASANDVYVTWPSNLGGSYQGYIGVSHDRGSTWVRTVIFPRMYINDTREIQVAACAGSNTQVPCAGTTNVYVTARVVGPGGGAANQWMVVSHDNGTTFSQPFDLAVQKKGHLGFGGIAVDGTSVYAFWGHKASNGIGQMWIDESQNQGDAWEGVQQVSSSTVGVIGLNDANTQHDQGPIVSASDGNVYTVWQDQSTGNGDVYFRAGVG